MESNNKTIGKKLPDFAETERLIISDTVFEEVDELQKIYETGEYLAPWVGDSCTPGYIEKCLTDPELPPGGGSDKKNCELKTVRKKDSEKIIGFLELYRGWPTDDNLYIPYFYLLPDVQGQGYGQKGMNWLFAAAKSCGFTKIGLGVHLKNWPALRFWTALGFTTITKIQGNKIHSDHTFCIVGLQKNL